MAVERFADTPEDYEHFRDPTKPPPVRFHWWWPLSWGTHRGRPFDAFLTKRSEMKIRRKRGQPDLQDATVSHQSVKLFGRKGSGTRAPTSVDDLESGVSGLGAGEERRAPAMSSMLVELKLKWLKVELLYRPDSCQVIQALWVGNHAGRGRRPEGHCMYGPCCPV